MKLWQCRVLLLAFLYLATEVRCGDHDPESEPEPEPGPPNLNADGVLEAPCGQVDHCDTCYNPFHTCMYCENNHILSLDTQHCFECPDHCAEGECVEKADHSGAECRECELGFYRCSEGQCKSCPGGCVECEEEASGIVVCSQCGPGTYINDGDQPCLSCPNYCLQCESPSKCEQCQNGFYIDNYGSCQACPGTPNCLECTSTQCTQCTGGMYWDGTTCSNCIDLCKVCVDDTTCEECLPGYFLTADRMLCLPITDCEEYDLTGGEGCTKCEIGNRRQEDLTCNDCPAINAENCGDCPVNGRGRVWDQDNNECKYCPQNCMSCHYDGSDLICDWCAEGMVWNMNQCESCDTVVLTEAAMCSKCNRYFDGSECVACAATLEEIDTAAECTGCVIDGRANLHVDGVCTDLDCSDLSTLDMNQCYMCQETVWDGSACLVANCTELPDNSEECDSCNMKAWEPAECIPVMCMGEFSVEMSCTECSGQYWDDTSSTCKAVDCASADTQEKCSGCLAHYWDGTNCVKIQDIAAECLADPGSLSEAMCLGCRVASVYWDSVGEECLSVDCAVDTLDSPAKCHACPGMYYDGADCLETAAEELCQGSFDSEAKCLTCMGRFWNESSETCVPADCTNAVTEEVCLGCHLYWDGIECLELECSSVTDEDQCDSCHSQGKYWNSETSECLTMDINGEATTAGQCKALPTRAWMAGYCVAVDCADPSILEEVPCGECDGYHWDSGTSACVAIDCTATIEDATICNQCADKYWDGTECVAMIDCATAIIHDTFRCHACTTDPAAPKWWSYEAGMCWRCPEDCLSCDHQSCLQCAAGKVWSAGSGSCTACGSMMVTEDMCESCAGFWWNGESSQCTSCGEGCDSCTNDIVCDVCSPGTTWDLNLEKCVDCVYETETECSTCGLANRGNFLDADGLCRNCPNGCSACDSYTVCTECYTSYFKDGFLCSPCAGAVLDTRDKCDVCGGATKYWHDGAASCENCIEFCDKCSGPECEQCAYGRYFDIDACKNCPANCLRCDSLTKCTLCSSGFYWDGSACTNCDANCAVCDTEDGCKSCNTGFFLDGQTCKNCLSNCDVCEDVTSCDQCGDNHCWDEDATMCQYTTNNCYECLKDTTTGTVSCLSCHPERYLDTCNACEVDGCMDCSRDSSECDECSPWLYYDDATDTCKDCPGDYCSVCEEDGSKCKTCNSMYYWSSSENSCTRCGDNCLECADANSCSQCMGENMFKNGRDCEQCMDNCAECSDASSCGRCYNSYYYDSAADPKECVQCPSNCAECWKDATGALQCDACEGGYFLRQDGTCEECSLQFQHCKMCKDNNADNIPECTWCDHEDGYVLADDSSACIVCSVDNCHACMDPLPYCTSCTSGFVRTEDWLACEHGCVKCEGAGCDAEGNSTLEACPGMGVTNDCWMVTVKIAGLKTVRKGCGEEKCDPDLEACNFIDVDETVKECKKCCTGHECELGGSSQLATSIISLFAVLLTARLTQWLVQ